MKRKLTQVLDEKSKFEFYTRTVDTRLKSTL